MLAKIDIKREFVGSVHISVDWALPTYRTTALQAANQTGQATIIVVTPKADSRSIHTYHTSKFLVRAYNRNVQVCG